MAPLLEVVECDHRLMFRLGERPGSSAEAGSEGAEPEVASRMAMYSLIESELVGLVCERDFLWPNFAPRCLTVEAEEEVVEFDRDSLRLTAGGRVGWLIF